MQWGNSEGIKGRCDAKCHNAVTPECDCMCGGRYHGKGRDGTLEQVLREDGDRILEYARRRAAAEGLNLEAFDVQLGLLERTR